MKKKIFAATAIMLIAICSISTVFAGYSSGDAKDDVASGVRVFDYANLMSEEAEKAASEEIINSNANTGMDVGIVVIDDAEGKSAMAYADDFYDYNEFGPDGALFLVDMDNRELWISTKGECIRYLTDDRIESILQVCVDSMPDDIETCVYSFITEYNDWFNRGIPDDQYNYDTETGEVDPYIPDDTLTTTDVMVVVGIAFVVAFFAGGIPCAIVFGKYRAIGKQYRYPVESRTTMNVTRSEDIFVREYTHTEKIQTDSDSGGRGGGGGSSSSTHTSSSGSSHGGGGKSF